MPARESVFLRALWIRGTSIRLRTSSPTMRSCSQSFGSSARWSSSVLFAEVSLPGWRSCRRGSTDSYGGITCEKPCGGQLPSHLWLLRPSVNLHRSRERKHCYCAGCDRKVSSVDARKCLAISQLQQVALRKHRIERGCPEEWWAHTRPAGSGSGHQFLGCRVEICGVGLMRGSDVLDHGPPPIQRLHYDLDEVSLPSLKEPTAASASLDVATWGNVAS